MRNTGQGPVTISLLLALKLYSFLAKIFSIGEPWNYKQKCVLRPIKYVYIGMSTGSI